MKNFILFTFMTVTTITSAALACDPILKSAQFNRDCAIQDRYVALREQFQKHGLNIKDIAEYKTIRFIDRTSWENAKTLQTSPHMIYGPAPMTWNVWNEGIDGLFPALSGKNRLFQGVDITNNLISHINTVLLTNGRDSIKDAITDEAKKPGEYRGEGDANVGFCSHDKMDFNAAVDKSELTLQLLQTNWEKQLGTTFEKLVVKNKGPNSGIARLGAFVRPRAPGCGPTGTGYWVTYVRSDQVADHMFWMRLFLNTTLNSYKSGKPLMAPIELSAFIQKWLVTVHPFADGNGRTSRGLQDLLLENFDMPFAPGGDLQNDALEDYNVYVDNTYSKIESTLSALENCARQLPTGQRTFECKTVQELNQ